jgi:hypothetical protein
MVNIQLVNKAAELNNYKYIQVIEFIPGEVLKINFQIQDPELGIRIMCGNAATMIATFMQNDGTEFTVNPTLLFSPGDNSIWTVTLDSAQTMVLVGNNFKISVDILGDTTDVRQGIANNVIAKFLFEGQC